MISANAGTGGGNTFWNSFSLACSLSRSRARALSLPLTRPPSLSRTHTPNEHRKRRRGNKFWNSLLSLAAVLVLATILATLELLDHVLRAPNECFPIDDVTWLAAGAGVREPPPLVRGLVHLLGRTLIYSLPRSRTHARTRSQLLAQVTQARKHARTYIHADICTRAHTCTAVRARTHMHTHAHTYTHACMPRWRTRTPSFLPSDTHI